MCLIFKNSVHCWKSKNFIYKAVCIECLFHLCFHMIMYSTRCFVVGQLHFNKEFENSEMFYAVNSAVTVMVKINSMC